MPKITKQATKKKVKKKTPVDSAWPEDDGIRINIYGRSGTGKTTLWSTFPKPIKVIVCSGGKKPGELRSINTPANRKVIHPHILQETSNIPKLLEDIDDYQTLVLDHATGLQDIVLKEILGLNELPAQSSWGIAKQQDWGQCALQMKENLRTLLSLSCNVVIVAQEREFNIDSEGDLLMPFVASALTPSVTGWLNPACDYICQTFIQSKTVDKVVTTVGKKEIMKKARMKGVDYCLRTAPHEVFTTKFRLPKGTPLPEMIIDPTYEKILALINQGG